MAKTITRVTADAATSKVVTQPPGKPRAAPTTISPSMTVMTPTPVVGNEV